MTDGGSVAMDGSVAATARGSVDPTLQNCGKTTRQGSTP